MALVFRNNREEEVVYPEHPGQDETYYLANPDDWGWGFGQRGQLWLVDLGVYGSTSVLVWGGGWGADEALDAAVAFADDMGWAGFSIPYEEVEQNIRSELEAAGHDPEDQGLLRTWVDDSEYSMTGDGYWFNRYEVSLREVHSASLFFYAAMASEVYSEVGSEVDLARLIAYGLSEEKTRPRALLLFAFASSDVRKELYSMQEFRRSAMKALDPHVQAKIFAWSLVGDEKEESYARLWAEALQLADPKVQVLVDHYLSDPRFMADPKVNPSRGRRAPRGARKPRPGRSRR